MTAIISVAVLLYIIWALGKPVSKYAGYLAWVAHGVVCFYSLFNENGWLLTIGNSILLVSWLSVLIVLTFKLASRWVKVPLLVFVFIAFILKYSSIISELPPVKEFSWQLDLHISLSMLAYALLAVASLFALSLYVHIKKIKNTDFAVSNNLMSLIDEEKKLFLLVFIGWLTLTTSLLSGVIFVEHFLDQHLGHKVVFSLLAWLIFGSIILGRLLKGWRGEKLISLTILGMASLATGYLGSKIVLELVL